MSAGLSTAGLAAIHGHDPQHLSLCEAGWGRLTAADVILLSDALHILPAELKVNAAPPTGRAPSRG